MSTMFLWLILDASAGGPPSCLALQPPRPRSHERVGLFRNAAWLGLRFYQVFVSPADGAGCRMYPSCSSYAMEAAGRNGPLLGTLLATSRITRNHSDPTYALCTIGAKTFRYDPVEADEWWRSSGRRQRRHRRSIDTSPTSD